MQKSILTGLLLLLCWMLAEGQRLTQRIYGPADGLPNVEFSFLIFDRDGFPYAASEGYLSRFDGYIVENYALDTTSIVTFPKELFFNAANELFYLSNDMKMFWKADKASPFVKIPVEGEVIPNCHFFEFRNRTYLSMTGVGLVEFNRDLKRFEHKKIYDVFDGFQLKDEAFQSVQLKGDDVLIVHVFENGERNFTLLRGDSTYTMASSSQVVYPLVFPGIITTIDDSSMIFHDFRQGAVRLYKNEFNEVGKSCSFKNFVGNEKHGFVSISDTLYNDEQFPKISYWFRIDTTLQVKYLGTSSLANSRLHKLDSREFFFTESHEGIIKMDPLIQFFPSGKGGIPPAIHALGEDNLGNIWFGGYAGGMNYWDGKEIRPGLDNRYRILPGSIRTQEGHLLFNRENRYECFDIYNGKVRELGLEYADGKQPTAAFYMEQLSDDKLVFGLLNKDYGIGLVDSITQDAIYFSTIGAEKGIELGNVLTITEDQLGRIWMGRVSTGIAMYDRTLDTAYTFPFNPVQKQGFGAISSETDDHNNIWFGTNDGFYFFEAPQKFKTGEKDLFKKIRKIPLPNGDVSNVTQMKQIENYLVFGNQSAVSFIPLSRWYQDESNCPIYQLYYGEDLEGNGSEQNAILQDTKGFLWIGSQNGVSRIDIRLYQFDTTQNKIQIRSITSGSIHLLPDRNDRIRIPTDIRNLTVTFSPENNISLLRNVFFDYTLTTGSGDTLLQKMYDQQGEIQVPYIHPGKYVLNIMAYKHGLLMDERRIEILVPYAFFENPWVLGFGIVFLVSGLVFYLFVRNRQRRKILERDLELARLNREKDHLQLQSIISSFNPHFINNSLHWAQSRYRQDEDLVKLIGRLSENIRYIFSMTRSGLAHHSLEKEMQLVENYILIQQIRFKDSFAFRKPAPELLESYASFHLPLMQLQIHVENAIEHGLRNRVGSGFVALDIQEETDYLHFTIADDGCGRQTAEELNSRGTQTGTRMLKELHTMFNQSESNKEKIESWYEDAIFTDELGNTYGTRVHIRIPKVYQYKLDD